VVSESKIFDISANQKANNWPTHSSHFPNEKKFTNNVEDLLSNISAHFRLVPLSAIILGK
jgi:hypothetical protein